jgi:hypothetical protein
MLPWKLTFKKEHKCLHHPGDNMWAETTSASEAANRSNTPIMPSYLFSGGKGKERKEGQDGGRKERTEGGREGGFASQDSIEVVKEDVHE